MRLQVRLTDCCGVGLDERVPVDSYVERRRYDVDRSAAAELVNNLATSQLYG